jgi:hypothetical protein
MPIIIYNILASANGYKLPHPPPQTKPIAVSAEQFPPSIRYRDRKNEKKG